MPSSPLRLRPRLELSPAASDSFLLPRVHLFDPSRGLDCESDILIRKGLIESLDPGTSVPPDVPVLEDLEGCWVFPGFVDVHAHLRTPGFEYKEDIASASRAAAAGGFVVVIGMANTDPVVDRAPVASAVLDRASRESRVRLGQVASVSNGLEGREMVEMGDLLEAGVVGFSDDGRSIEDADLLRQALRYLDGTGVPILLHSEDGSLSERGVMHEGAWSSRLGLRGIPSAAESGRVARDLELLRSVSEGTRLHVQHVSAEATLRVLRTARAEGLGVTAEVTPHHLLLTDAELAGFDTSLKINPPLRTEADRHALVGGLASGEIDCVATDHAPHAPHEKEVPLEDAPFGTVGLETAFPALYEGLVVPGHISLSRLVETLTTGPCRCLGLEAPRLETDVLADLSVWDLDEEWEVGRAALSGKSRNSAFLGRRVRGRLRMTMAAGTRVFGEGSEGHV